MTDLIEMWRELERYQPYAEKHGFGEAWKRMTTQRTQDAAWAAAYVAAAWAAAFAASAAAEAAAWAAEAEAAARRAIGKIREAIAQEEPRRRSRYEQS